MQIISCYDSVTQKTSQLKPLEKDHIRLYVCGITVYDLCHIGHARAMIVFDAWVGYLRSLGYKVTYVRNITDIEDKIIQRANLREIPWQDLTEEMIQAMHKDTQALGLSAPDHEPRATEYIQEMIDLIERLIAKNHAYVTESGDVRFAVKSFADYGKLSHRNVDDLISGARVAVESDKKNPLDFVLWKSAKPGEPSWQSPWGEGRPGWHIECSAMSEALLGTPFDVHGGGMDLKFPHHENEIAQSETACGCEMVKHWMHVGLVNVDNEKMSKSLGNFITIRDVLKTYSAEVMRYLMLSSHYRSPVNYSDDQCRGAEQALRRLYSALDGCDLTQTAIDSPEYADKFYAALADDFNIPVALSVVFDVVREINRLKDSGDSQSASAHAAMIKSWMAPLNLLQDNPTDVLRGESDDEEKIEALIAERNTARAEKNWARADEIRDELLAMKIEILDSAEKTTWRKLV